MDRCIEVSRATIVGFTRAREVLVDHLGPVLGDLGRLGPNRRTFTVVLTDGPVDGAPHLREVVELVVGGIRLHLERAALDVSWRALDHARLFPHFRGTLELALSPVGTAVRLRGTYRPPLGIVGAFGDGVVGHRLARQSLERYLDGLVARLETFAAATGQPEERHAHAR